MAEMSSMIKKSVELEIEIFSCSKKLKLRKESRPGMGPCKIA
jgi:hypothetical protein